MQRIGIVVLAVGCWSGEPRTPASPVPVPVSRPAPIPEEPDEPVVEDSDPLPAIATPVSFAVEDPDLAGRLRNGELGKLIRGPVVVLDLDARSFGTFCGALAGRLAHDISLKLMDPTRSAAYCTTHANLGRTRCAQLVISTGRTGQQQIERVVVELDDRDARRLLSIVVGTEYAQPALARQLDAQVAAATCP